MPYMHGIRPHSRNYPYRQDRGIFWIRSQSVNPTVIRRRNRAILRQALRKFVRRTSGRTRGYRARVLANARDRSLGHRRAKIAACRRKCARASGIRSRRSGRFAPRRLTPTRAANALFYPPSLYW